MARTTNVNDVYSRFQTEVPLLSQQNINAARDFLTDNRKRTLTAGMDGLAKRLVQPQEVNTQISNFSTEVENVTTESQLDSARSRIPELNSQINGLEINLPKPELRDLISEAEGTLERIAIEVETLVVTVEGEDFEIPKKFKRGRPKEVVSDIVQSLAGEFIGDLESARTKEQAERLDVPDNLPNSLIRFLKSQRRARIKELPSEEV